MMKNICLNGWIDCVTPSGLKCTSLLQCAIIITSLRDYIPDMLTDSGIKFTEGLFIKAD